MLNKVILIGRLGSDPETQNYGGDKVKATFSVATNESYKDKNGEWQDSTTWHNCVAWGPAAERVEKALVKGDLVYIEGSIDVQKYTPQGGGEQKTYTSIKVRIFKRLNKREATGSSEAMPEAYDEPRSNLTPPDPAPSQSQEPDDDLPF